MQTQSQLVCESDQRLRFVFSARNGKPLVYPAERMVLATLATVPVPHPNSFAVFWMKSLELQIIPSLSHAYGLGHALYGACSTSQQLCRLEDALAFGELRPDIRISGSPRASDGSA